MLDDEGQTLDIAYRAQLAGHLVRYWTPRFEWIGKGLVPKVKEFKPSMDWAELIVLSGNCDYPSVLKRSFADGYPILGASPAAAELELDRGKGQELLKSVGVDTLPYVVVDSLNDAAAYLLKTQEPCVIKPWGGIADKALTHVCKSVDDGLFTLARWKKLGIGKGDKLMLQQKVSGVEVGIAGWFGPGGWCRMVEESFEHKKFMVGELGQNTGEMGTVLRHMPQAESELFHQVLEPVTDHLRLLHYVGNCSVNCIVTEGTPYPLEFTMRCGWPSTCLTLAAVEGDPVSWLRDLLLGQDTFNPSEDVVTGICTPHGDFPWCKDDPKEWSEFPFYGITRPMVKSLHFQQAMWGESPAAVEGKREMLEGFQTAGQYPLVVSGRGGTVRQSQRAAYRTVEKISLPSNLMYRTDIGDRLREGLAELQDHGFCTSWEW
jgi:phosphoribosylamine--glycine ligase